MSFEKMAVVGTLTAQCLEELKSLIKPDITTKDIETYVVDFQERHKLQNSQYGYFGFPGYCCTSINDEICHGIPSLKRILKEGDIVKVDVTFNKDGWHGDACYTYPVGIVSIRALRLIEITKDCLRLGIEAAQPGNSISEIGKTIEQRLAGHDFSVVHDYCGHSIGQKMHLLPRIPHNHLKEFDKIIIKPGMMFTIEPMIVADSQSNYKYKLGDDWTVYTKNGSISAQFEHTLGITNNGPIIFTKI